MNGEGDEDLEFVIQTSEKGLRFTCGGLVLETLIWAWMPWSWVGPFPFLALHMTQRGVRIGPRNLLLHLLMWGEIPTLEVQWKDIESIELLHDWHIGMWALTVVAGVSTVGDSCEPFAIWASQKKVRTIMGIAENHGVRVDFTPTPLFSSRFYEQTLFWYNRKFHKKGRKT